MFSKMLLRHQWTDLTVSSFRNKSMCRPRASGCCELLRAARGPARGAWSSSCTTQRPGTGAGAPRRAITSLSRSPPQDGEAYASLRAACGCAAWPPAVELREPRCRASAPAAASLPSPALPWPALLTAPRDAR